MTDSNRKIGFAASGGGFRASLFHLGVLRRLHELHILDQIDFMSGVSGGAVTTALYTHLKRKHGAQFDLDEMERCLLAGVKKNPRTRWLAVTLVLRFTVRLLPLTWWGPLERAFRNRFFAFDQFFHSQFFQNTTLTDLNPTHSPVKLPRLILNTTQLELGQDFFLTPDYVGPRPEGGLGVKLPAKGAAPTRTDPANYPLAHAVGASACVPGIFPPYTIAVTPDAQDDGKDWTGLSLAHVRLVDGGVYDNQGFRLFLDEPHDQTLRNPKTPLHPVTHIIASDASKTLIPSASPPTNPFKRVFLLLPELLMRAQNITQDRVRWEQFSVLLYAKNAGDITQTAFFSTSSPHQEERPYCLPDDIRRNLARLRTDFDSFSDLEIIGLMYLGYTTVNHRIFSYCRDLLPPETRAALKDVGSRADADPPGHTPWQTLLEKLGVVPQVAPLKRWNEFAADVTQRLPQRGRLARWFLPGVEAPWRPFLQEADPCDPRNQEARRMAARHLEHGATGSLVWRATERLKDRGGSARPVATALQGIIVGGLIALGVAAAWGVWWLFSHGLHFAQHWLSSAWHALLG